MAKNTKKKAVTGEKKLTDKQRLWLRNFLNSGNPATFLNKAESTRQAGYDCENDQSASVIGCQNFAKLKDRISEWIQKEGLGDNQLKCLLISGLEANETKFFAHEGMVVEQRDVVAWSIRKQYLELALKVQGMLTEKHEHTGKDGGPVQIAVDPWKEIINEVSQVNSDELPNRSD